MAYFAGAGTVIAAIGLGLGGGLTIANVMSPHQDKPEQTKLEQRMSAKPIPPSAEADQAKQQAETGTKSAVPYVAATNAAITANAPPAQTQNQPQPQTQAAAPAPQPSPQPPEAKLANKQPAKPVEPQAAKPQPAPREQASSPSDDGNAKASSPEDANAKARDSDLKRLAAEKRKADRRQQWADRKKAQQQRDAQPRDVDAGVRRDSDGHSDGPRVIRDNRDSVRDSVGPRIVVQQDDDDFDRRGDSDRRRDLDRRGGPDRPFGFPGFNLFGGDRDD
jgi:hypothetical protein